MCIHRFICFSSCSYLICITFLLAMQVAEASEGEVITDAQAYDRMRMKRPDLSQPQPSLPVFFGNSAESRQAYIDMVRARHPEVDDPMDLEIDQESLLLSSHGLEHGRTQYFNVAVRDSLSTTYTRVKATAAPDIPLPPRRQPRRPSYDVSFHHLSYFYSCMAKCLGDSLFVKL